MSSGYDSSTEALDEVLNSNHITEISTSISRLADGTEYSFVEVTCGDGAQHGLQACGKEAVELNRMAIVNAPKEQL